MRLRWIHSVALPACLLLGSLLQVDPAAAQLAAQPPPEVLDGVGMDERFGQAVPLDLAFRDEAGRETPLAAFFDGEKPVILNLVYHDCPMLCNLVLDKFTASLGEMAWTPGEAFEVLTVSFNAIETPALAARQKDRYLAALGRPEAARGWHFLTGDAAAIERLTEAVGFRFRWIAQQQEFAHPAALIFLSGDGTITRYLYGLDFPPRDVRSALVEASEGAVGTPLDQVFLYCFRYDPQANAYVADAVALMQIGGLLTMLALGAMLLFFWRREGHKQQERAFEWPGSPS